MTVQLWLKSTIAPPEVATAAAGGTIRRQSSPSGRTDPTAQNLDSLFLLAITMTSKPPGTQGKHSPFYAQL